MTQEPTGDRALEQLKVRERKERKLKNLIRSWLGLDISRASHPVNIWDSTEDFVESYEKIRDDTSVGDARCFMIYQFAKQARSLDGDVAEVGVYRGGTAKLIAEVFKGRNKTVHLFDTFSGMPTVSNIDLMKDGDFSKTSLEGVRRFLADCDNVAFHMGVFPQTAEPLSNLSFCFVHIDVDIYRSVLDCLEFFYPRMTTGGVMLLDDYEWVRCPGVKKAVTEFLSDKRESLIVTTRYQGAIVKLGTRL